MTITAGTTATLRTDLYEYGRRIARSGDEVDVIYVRPQGFSSPRATIRVPDNRVGYTPQLQIVSTDDLDA